LPRKPPSQIIDAIYAVINVKRAMSVNQIAAEAGISWRTARDYVELILKVQDLPELIVVPMEDGFDRYKRASMAGRPPKK
jgi:hypothetical protein